MRGTSTHDEQFDVLSGLIAFDSDDRAIWPAEDLRESLRQRLNSCTLLESGRSTPAEHAAVGDLALLASPPIHTFSDLIHHPRPPMALLWIVKDSAKRNAVSRRSLCPPEMWMVVYYGAILGALMRHNQRITTLSDDELRQGLNWAVRQPWLDAPTQRVFREGLRFLASGRHLWRR